MAFFLACRLPNLLALPIFGDESIYLRWAQLIRGESVSTGHHWWVSLADPKPPLHFWLLALVFHWTADPLLAARLLSVAVGIAMMPLFLGIGAELAPFLPATRTKPSLTLRVPSGGPSLTLRVPSGSLSAGRKIGLVAAILALFCPFLAFYQRLATADALFVTESVLTIYLSLRWARLSANPRKRDGWLTAVLLGVSLAAGLMTRQGISYTLCAFPVVAWCLHSFTFAPLPKSAETPAPPDAAPPASPPGLPWQKSLAQLFLAAVVAVGLWTPYLTAELSDYALQNRPVPPTVGSASRAPSSDDIQAELRRRILYQAKFTESSIKRSDLIQRNARVTFMPGQDLKGNPNSGWLPLYMTPIVFGVSVLGFLYAIRRPKIFLILLVWLILLLVPVIFLVDTIYSRYVLAAVPPFLFAAGLLLADVTTWLLARTGRAKIAGLAAAAAIAAGVLYLPTKDLAIQTFDWRKQVLTEKFLWGGQFVRGDRYQYITGWTAGTGTRDAIAFLTAEARRIAPKPMAIITTSTWGTPADAVWVYLSREPNVKLYWNQGKPRRGADGVFRLREEKWLAAPEESVRFAAGTVIYYVANDPVHADVDIPLADYLRDVRANLGTPKSFNGVDDEGVKVLEVLP